MLRSQDMSLIMLYLNRDIAKQGIQHIGQHPSIHFINLNTHMKVDQLPFNKEIRFLEKLLVRIKFLDDESALIERKSDSKYKTKNLENEINKHYTRLIYLREIRRDTLEKIKTLREDMFVVEELESYISNGMAEADENYKMNLDHVCFIISKDKKVMLESVLYHNLRRNACVYNSDKTIEIHEAESFYNVSGYVIFIHGVAAVEKVDALITSLGGRVVSKKSIQMGSIGLNDKISQVSRIFENNEAAIESELNLIAEKIEYWKYCVSKEMKIYTTMNGLGFGKDSENLVGQGFILKDDIKKIKSLCDYITKKHGYAHFDIIKHYSYKTGMNNGNVYDLHEEGAKRLENSSDDCAYEMWESDSDIQVVIKSSRQEKKQNRSEPYSSENSGTQSIGSVQPGGSSVDVTERHLSEEGTDYPSQDISDSTKSPALCEKVDNSPEIASRHTKETKTSTPRNENNETCNLLNKHLYKSKSNSTPSIIALDEEKLQTLELPNFVVEKPETPPTHFYTNKFTRAFQELNDVYGVPAYKEINPATFYIVTFPFMFGVMFGDVGHGLLLLSIACYSIRKEKTLKVPEFLELIFAGRYIMLLCSLWSIFFGFIYSDFLSLPLPLFPSEFTNVGGKLVKDPNYTYPFGIDHAWVHKKNSALFFNSLKMKMSIILGFTHMLLGSVLSLLNTRYCGDKITMFCVVIPQAVAFVSFVGYLIFLIFFKWVSTENRQGIISVIVSMFTSPFELQNPMYPFQKQVQLFLLCNIVVSIIWMLFSKSMYETLKLRKKKMAKKNIQRENAEEGGDDLIEIWMHGMIETIEFGIGLVSNTSSYLRLWAISLAHAELTNVLYTMTIGVGGILSRALWFPVWVFFTLVLLIGLEGLSSCLHAIRLNWIEFNIKFYKGTGYPFRPLDFKTNYDD